MRFSNKKLQRQKTFVHTFESYITRVFNMQMMYIDKYICLLNVHSRCTCTISVPKCTENISQKGLTVLRNASYTYVHESYYTA